MATPARIAYNRRMKFSPACLCVTALSLVALGCGDPSARQAITGRVAYQGADLLEGTIHFFPKNAAEGDATGAMIVKGRYTIDAAHGLPPGVYDVRISSPNHKGKRPDASVAPGAPYLAAELLPAKYNLKSELSIEVAPNSGKKEYDFLLE